MTAPLRMTLRLRLPFTVSAALGLVAVLLAVGALFPAVGHTIGKLSLPHGVSQLLGGADYATVAGWFRSEIGAVYGPLLAGAVAISSAASVTAGEEEDRILGLVLALPITRGRLVVAKAAAVAVLVVIIAASAWIGLVVGVAFAGGGVSTGDLPRTRSIWPSSDWPWARSRWPRAPAPGGAPWPPESPPAWASSAGWSTGSPRW